MSISGFRSINDLTKIQGNSGVVVGTIPGQGGLGPDAFDIIASADGLPPNNPGITIQIFPSGFFEAGTDSLGQIGLVKSFTNNGNDKSFAWSGGSASFPSGLWQQNIRIVVAAPGECSIDLGINFNCPDPNDPADFPNNLTDKPHDITVTDTSFDPDTEQGSTLISFKYDNADAEDPVGLAIMRAGPYGAPTSNPPTTDFEPTASVPWENGTTDYTYTDVVFESGYYTYTVLAYKYSSPYAISLYDSLEYAEAEFIGGVTPDIAIIGGIGSEGEVDFGGSAILVFIGDPSGIYTLIVDKKYDTLYDRTGDVSNDVKIPDPFIVTAFVPVK